MTALILPRPTLDEGCFASVPVFTDEALFEACGVRIAFTMRAGGVSEGPYASLNLGSHVQDDLDKVLQNRALLFSALAPSLEESEEALIVPKQVHGDTVLQLGRHVRSLAYSGQRMRRRWDHRFSREVGALLCFADCMPVIIVLPTGRFAVVHAGWRGIENEISAKVLDLMLDQECQEHDFSRSELAAQTNVYIGPYIHRECFETGADIHALFVTKFGKECRFNETHIDLGAALRVQLVARGIDPARICDLDRCTVCENDRFFSFRAQGWRVGSPRCVRDPSLASFTVQRHARTLFSGAI